MEIISSIALISINETLFIQLISFLIFLFFINRIMFRPLQTVMHDRNKYIDDLKEKVQDSKNRMDSLLTQLSERELEAKEEAFNVQKKLEEAGNSEASQIFTETKAEVARQTEKAENSVHVQMKEAQKHLKEEAESIANIIMEKVLNRRLVQ